LKIPIYCAHDAVLAIDQLKPNPANPNKHPPEQIRLLAKIIKAQGWRNPIVVSNRSGLITKGHGRLDAARVLKTDTAPVDYQDYASEQEELADMVADNRIAELAEADRAMLRELAEHLDDGAFDMELLGFDEAALEELMTAAPPESDVDAEPQIDKADELAAKWKVKRGQIWELNAHRLMCGDSTNQENVRVLVNGESVDVTLTDPPYGMRLDTDWTDAIGSIGRKNRTTGNKYAAVIGDDKPFDPSPIFELWTAPEMFLFGADYYAEKIPSRIDGSWLVWDKRKDSQADAIGAEFELIWSKSKHKRRMLRHDWFGFLSSANGSDARNRQHPTQKPTSLLADILRQWSSKDSLVADPYLGSGTTLIACEQLGRKCRAMEISPGYVAVAIQRWADATGKTPRLLK
jgi:DNA modification methylase